MQLSDVSAFIRRNLWLIGLSSVLGAFVAAIYLAVTPPRYQFSSVVAVKPTQAVSGSQSGTASEYERSLGVLRVKHTAIFEQLRQADRASPLTLTPTEFDRVISVRMPPDSTEVEFEVVDSDPDVARNRAEIVAGRFERSVGKLGLDAHQVHRNESVDKVGRAYAVWVGIAYGALAGIGCAVLRERRRDA